MYSIIQFLFQVGGQTTAEIADELGYSKSYISTACRVLYDSKLLVREREGRAFVYKTTIKPGKIVKLIGDNPGIIPNFKTAFKS